MAEDYAKIFNSIDKLIVSYKTNEALKILEGVTQAKIPDSQRAAFAALARRLARPKMALKILHPNILDIRTAKSEDAVEYATNLRRLGLINQCRRLLEVSKAGRNRFLHLAFCSIHQWDYRKAAEELQEYLGPSGGDPKIDQKLRLIAQVNLVAALIYTESWDEAEKLLNILQSECENFYPHLFLNCLELRSQIQIFNRQLVSATQTLDQAKVLAGQQEGFTTNQIEKWDWIVRVLDQSTDPQGEKIALFRQKVRREGDWETLRHFDWQLAKVTGNLQQIQAAFFCTPYEKFKAMFTDPMPKVMTRVDPRFKGEPLFINSLTGEGLRIPFGLTEHRLLILMLSDKYQPWTVQRIFDFLYSDENFDPFTSPRKIYQLLDRLGKNIGSNQGLELSHSRVGYRLRPLGSGHCHVFEKMVFQSSDELLAFIVKLAFGERNFSAEELRAIIPSLSSSKTYRALHDLQEAGILKSVGAAKVKSFVLKVE